MKVGDKVKYVGESDNYWYPPKGTIGKIIYLSDNSEHLVQWPPGTTLYDGKWYAYEVDLVVCDSVLDKIITLREELFEALERTREYVEEVKHLNEPSVISHCQGKIITYINVISKLYEIIEREATDGIK